MDPEFNPTYYNTVDQIYNAEWTSTKLARFERLRSSMDKLWPNGHPTKLIHVAGTNGKGSFCRYLEAGLSLHGRSASFTSPHLFDYRERFSIQGKDVSQDDVTEAWEEKVRPLCVELALKGGEFTHAFSEISILIALVLFEKHEVEWAAIEAGLGGRYDQTTALDFVATAITNIGNDHENLLGHERWQRTMDKGGVCQKDRPLFTSVQDDESLKFIESICRHMNAPFYQIKKEDVENIKQELGELYPDGLAHDALINAEHQLWNATLSLAVIKHLLPDLKNKDILKKFTDIRFKGRFQKIEEGIYIDVAHNPDKINVFANEINKKFPKKTKTFIIGLSGTRSAKEIFPPILEIADNIIVTTAAYRGVMLSEIEQELDTINTRKIPIKIVADPHDALEEAKKSLDEKNMIILTGSTYMIDQALNTDPYLRYINASYGWRTQEDEDEKEIKDTTLKS